jgi:hypothetical protein
MTRTRAGNNAFIRKAMLLVLMVAMLTGCSSTYRTIVVKNTGSGPLDNFNLRTFSGGFDVRFGYLAVNPHPGNLGAGFQSEMRIRRADVCILTWTDASGQKHEVQVDLSKESQLAGGRGLLFNVHDDAVQTRSFKD